MCRDCAMYLLITVQTFTVVKWSQRSLSTKRFSTWPGEGRGSGHPSISSTVNSRRIFFVKTWHLRGMSTLKTLSCLNPKGLFKTPEAASGTSTGPFWAATLGDLLEMFEGKNKVCVSHDIHVIILIIYIYIYHKYYIDIIYIDSMII